MQISDNISSGSLEATSAYDDGQPGTVTVVAAMCASLLAIVIVAGNLLVITAFAKDKSLRSIANSFLVSMACADLLVGVVVIPFYIYLHFASLGHRHLGQGACFFFYAMDVMASTASILHLCVISADRYGAIVHPMAYTVKMTRRVAGVLMLVVWGLSLCGSFPWIMYWNGILVSAVFPAPGLDNECLQPSPALFSIVSSCISFFLPATIIIVMYAKMFHVAHRYNRRLRKGRLQLGNCGGEHPHQESMRIHRGGFAQPQAQQHVREYQAAKTVGLVIGAFLVCWLPVFIVIVITPWCGEACTKPRSYINWLGFINSAVNPFIYAFANLQFRAAFARIVCFARNRTGGGKNGPHSVGRDNTFFSRHAPQTEAPNSPPTSYKLKHIYF